MERVLTVHILRQLQRAGSDIDFTEVKGLKQEMTKKRAGICVFSDRDGNADKSSLYLLCEMKKNLDKLIVIVNGRLSGPSYAKLREISDKLFIKHEKDSDSLSWRFGILKAFGMEELPKYDSLVLFTNRLFGPVFPLDKVLSEMDEKRRDIWGLSAVGLYREKGVFTDRFRGGYIDPDFLVINSSMMREKFFADFIENDKAFYDRNSNFARRLTMLAHRNGMRLGSYLKTLEEEKNYEQLKYNIYELVSSQGCPFIPKELFCEEKAALLKFTNAGEPARLLDYLKNNTDYDVSMIYDYLSAKCEPAQNKEILGLDLVPEKQGNIKIKKKEAAVIAHLVYEDMFEKNAGYLKNLPENVDVYVTTNTGDRVEKLRNILNAAGLKKAEIRLVENRGRDVAALLSDCWDIPENYEYFCFIHDKKSSAKEFSPIGREFDRINWECLLSDEDHVKGIISLLRDHNELGLLTPFAVNHGSYFLTSMDYWTVNRENTCNLADRIGVRRPDTAKKCIAVGTCFWARSSALEKLFEMNWKHEDFDEEPMAGDGTISHAIERIFPYVAADAGYLTAWIYTPEYARLALTDNRYMLDTAVSELEKHSVVKYQSFEGLIKAIKKLGREKKSIYYKGKMSPEFREKIKKATPAPVLKAIQKHKYGIVISD